MIAIVTDSNAQLPPELVDRYGLEVVPLTITIDGVDYAEGIDLDPDGFYARFADGPPTVTTSQPSPGRFTEAYVRAAERGADQILSIHIGSAVSGTLNSARLAAGSSPVPVRLVDTGTASFGVGCCVWEAAESLRAGASIEDAAAIAERLAGVVDNVFVVQALDLARAGGRLAADIDADAEAKTEAEPDAIPVLSLVEGEIRAVGRAYDVEEAATVMADHLLSGVPRPRRPGLAAPPLALRRSHAQLRAAVGIADAAATPFWTALEDRLRAAPQVKEVVRYRIGPSVGAHTGPGTAGAFAYPAR